MNDELWLLTQDNYNGYCAKAGWKSLATGDDLPSFENLPQKIKDAWLAGTIAVLNRYQASLAS